MYQLPRRVINSEIHSGEEDRLSSPAGTQIDNSASSRAGVQGGPNYSGRRIAGRVARHRL